MQLTYIGLQSAFTLEVNNELSESINATPIS